MIVSTSHRVCTIKNIDFTDFFNVFLSGATIYSVSFFLGRATRLELATGIPQMAICHLQEPCRTSDEICACGARWRQRVRAQNEKDPSAASLKDLSFWSGRRGSNSLPPPWQGGALPDELRPRNNGYFNKPCRNCQALFHFFLLPSAAHLPPAVKAASGAPVGGGLCPLPPVWTEAGTEPVAFRRRME